MTTLTIEYDEHEKAFASLLEAFKKLGGSVVKCEKKNQLDLAIEEMENGQLIVCDDFEDFVKKMNEDA